MMLTIKSSIPQARRYLLITGVVAGSVLAVIVLAGVAVWWSVPRVGWLRSENPETSAFIERNRASGVTINWRWVPVDDVSPHLLLAILVAEDIEFFQHGGFSVAEVRAALRTARERGQAPRGASTITQQVAKNLWLSPERSAMRKLQEAVLAWKLERRLGKRRILELYVNVVEFGPGVYGAAAAAERFFRTDPLWLTPGQSAQLASGLSRPSVWNPAASTEAYAQRVALIRGRMDRATFLWRHLVPLYRGAP